MIKNIIQFIRNLFIQKPTKSDDVLSNITSNGYAIIQGDKWEIGKRVNEMIKDGANIKHTTLTKDFQKYGHTEQFVLGVYYE